MKKSVFILFVSSLVPFVSMASPSLDPKLPQHKRVMVEFREASETSGPSCSPSINFTQACLVALPWASEIPVVNIGAVVIGTTLVTLVAKPSDIALAAPAIPFVSGTLLDPTWLLDANKSWLPIMMAIAPVVLHASSSEDTGAEVRAAGRILDALKKKGSGIETVEAAASGNATAQSMIGQIIASLPETLRDAGRRYVEQHAPNDPTGMDRKPLPPREF